MPDWGQDEEDEADGEQVALHKQPRGSNDQN